MFYVYQKYTLHTVRTSRNRAKIAPNRMEVYFVQFYYQPYAII